VAYHGSRILSYAAIGLLSGLIGRAVSDVLLGGTTRWLTWAFVVFFVLVATGLDKQMRIPVAGAWMSGCLGGQDSALVRAAILGSLTPFIPCGPLYIIVGAASLSGSAASGAAVLAAFAAGTVPLVFAIQSQHFRLKFSPVVLDRVRRGLAAVSVGLLVYRGIGDPGMLCQ
jgi:sulfite exporter TauE/SafE